MGSTVVHEDIGVSQRNRAPACQWSFNRARQFHHISGDFGRFFHRLPAELLRQHVSIIDDSQGSWTARLDRMFSGEAQMEEWTTAKPGPAYVLIHVPVRAAAGQVIYTAGFALPAGSQPATKAELELAATAALQAVETERARATRFLHDIVAQSLSGTGLQLELQRLEGGDSNAEAVKRASDIQHMIEEVLKLIREFNAPE
jgi:signal transduction histidine kinase